ncbi:MAG: universal stress protein [Cyclobacteriaceae bacterium]
MKKLLIPVDFSETSESAVDFGVQLAKRFGYSISLLHSINLFGTYESMYADGPQIQSFTDKLVEDMEIRMDNLKTRYREEGLVINTHITSESLVQDIRKIVREHDIDLIVMGTKGVSGFKEFFVGSNTEKVVRLVDLPVISIPNKTNLTDIRQIMVPVDLGEIRPSFLTEISLLQQLFSASIEFVWVKTPHDIENLELLTEEFNNLLNDYEIASSSFTIKHDIFPQDGILTFAHNSGADMLAMATHSRRGIAHWFSGSMTEDVMNHIKLPVWSFKIQDEERPLNLESFQKLHSEDQIKEL